MFTYSCTIFPCRPYSTLRWSADDYVIYFSCPAWFSWCTNCHPHDHPRHSAHGEHNMEKKSVSSRLGLLHCQLATCSVSQHKDAKSNTLLLLMCTCEWTFVIPVMYFLPIHRRLQKSVSFWRWLMSFRIMVLHADHLCLLPTNMEMSSTYLPLLTYCSTAFHSLFSCMYTAMRAEWLRQGHHTIA